MDHIVHTRYCGSLKMEVNYTGQLESLVDTHVYQIEAKLGHAPLWVRGSVEIKLSDRNPEGREALILACNQFIEQIQHQSEGHKVVLMDLMTFKVQLSNITCQNVEGILQSDQPKWLISDREV